VDRRPGIEGDLRHLAGQFGRDGHALHRRQGAHGLQLLRPELGLDLGGGHRGRRRHEGLAVVDQGADLQGLRGGQAGDHQEQTRHGEEEGFFHVGPP